MKNIDKYRGCLIGGAAGDALGYAVGFLDSADIFHQYGERGITEYKLVDGVAQVSDDTQMTLFTANGLLLATTGGVSRSNMDAYSAHIAQSYGDWLKTQTQSYPVRESCASWLLNNPQLFAKRDSGNIHWGTIERGANRTIGAKLSSSKSCDGMTCMAPIGLYFGGKDYLPEEIAWIAAQTAVATHEHELSCITAAAFVYILHMITHESNMRLQEAVEDSMAAMKWLFPNAKHLNTLLYLVQRAIDLSMSCIHDKAAIRQLGEGRLAEETLAVAIYCTLKYQNDFDKAVIASVNHGGDSDSTGSVTGNILGAYLGFSRIPEKYIKNLELKDIILELADDLFYDYQITEHGFCQDDIWISKYIKKTYKK